MRFEHAHAQGIIQRLQMSLQGWAQSRPGSPLSRSWLFRRVVSFISSLRGRRKKGRGWGKGEREKGIQSNPIQSSSPFSLPPFLPIPYPLPLLTPATQATLYLTLETVAQKIFCDSKIEILIFGFFLIEREIQKWMKIHTSRGSEVEDSWSPQLISYQDLGTRLAPSPTNVLVRRKHSWRQNHSTSDIPLEGGPDL